MYRDRLRIIAPEPAQNIGHDGCALLAAVASLAHLQLDVVARIFQRLEHHLIIDGPATRVECAEWLSGYDVVLLAILHENPQRLGLGLADESGHRIRALHRDERSNETDHAAELVGPVPRRHERGHGARTRPGESPIVRIARQVVLLGHLGNHLANQKAGEAIAQRIVFEDALIAVLRRVRNRRQHARVDEDSDHRRQLFAGDQVIEHHRHALAVADGAAAIHIDHERRGLTRVILCRDINPIRVRRARIKLARLQLVFGHRPLGNAVVRLGVGTERVVLRAPA